MPSEEGKGLLRLLFKQPRTEEKTELAELLAVLDDKDASAKSRARALKEIHSMDLD